MLATMSFDAATALSLLHDVPVPHFDALHAHASARPAAPSRLVLFVGVTPTLDLAALLATEGMRCLSLASVAASLEAARLARFDAAVLHAPALGATQGRALAHLRLALGCPLLVWAGPDDEVDEILALEQGADAWLPQPIEPRRLRAHLLALLRSHGPAAEAADDLLPCRWHVDRVHNRLQGAAPRPVALTEAQAALLQCLVDADGRVVPRARLADALVPSHGHALQARSIDVYVHRLRSRLRRAGATGHDIEAVRGRGYRLCAEPSANIRPD
jgi:two-component system OmpR family response regulator